jgi:hypothetical protein
VGARGTGVLGIAVGKSSGRQAGRNIGSDRGSGERLGVHVVLRGKIGGSTLHPLNILRTANS